jgi:hypothetical protein
MRRAKLFFVDDAVAVAVEGEEGGGGVLDFFGIEPVIVIAIEGLAEWIKGRWAGWSSAELGRWWAAPRAARRLGHGQRAQADQRDRRGDSAPGSCSEFHRIHPAFWFGHRPDRAAVERPPIIPSIRLHT